MKGIDSRHLCRGKRCDTGEWVTGYYYYTQDTDKNYIGIGTSAGCFYGLEVDPATVGRCTGLEDKTGQLIFEGDIAQKGDVLIHIFYGNGFDLAWLFTVINPKSKEDTGTFGLCAHSSDEVEIIGNRWDNPEFLEGAV